MLRTTDCFKNLFQYKRVCPDLALSYTLNDEDVTTATDEDLQQLYNEYLRKYAALTICETKRTYVHEECYDDKDEGHRLAIERVKQQISECTQTLTVLSSELENRHTTRQMAKLSLKELASEESQTAPGKNAKKNAKKRRRNAARRNIKDEKAYKEAWQQLDDELTRIEAAQADVYVRMLNITERLQEQDLENSERYATLLDHFKRDPTGYHAYKALIFSHPSQALSSDVLEVQRMRNIDVSQLTDADIELWVRDTSKSLVPLQRVIALIDNTQILMRNKRWPSQAQRDARKMFFLCILACFHIQSYYMEDEFMKLYISYYLIIHPLTAEALRRTERSTSQKRSDQRRYLAFFDAQYRSEIDELLKGMFQRLVGNSREVPYDKCIKAFESLEYYDALQKQTTTREYLQRFYFIDLGSKVRALNEAAFEHVFIDVEPLPMGRDIKVDQPT